jgi:hypothetical protein
MAREWRLSLPSWSPWPVTAARTTGSYGHGGVTANTWTT